MAVNTTSQNFGCNLVTCFELRGSLAGQYRGADKSLARPTSRFILFDGENISFDASLVILTYSMEQSPS